MDALISKVWRLGAQPLLFGCAGAAVSASLLPEHTMIKALLLVCVGMCPGSNAVCAPSSSLKSSWCTCSGAACMLCAGESSANLLMAALTDT